LLTVAPYTSPKCAVISPVGNPCVPKAQMI
jgi:hypothetical protein